MKKFLPLLMLSLIALPVLLALAAEPSTQRPAVPASSSPAGGGNGSGPIEAYTAARYDLRLGFTVPGRVAQVKVKPGDKVEAGQVLVELEDEEGKAMVELYQLQFDSDLAVQSAQEQLKAAQLEEELLRGVLAKGAGNPDELRRATLKRKLAEIDEKTAHQQHDELGLQLRQHQARHEQYQLKAPVAGLIDIAQISPGDSVEALKPVVRLVVTDPLWIEVPVPTPATLSLKVGDAAVVHSPLPGFEEPIAGRILHIAAVADAASNTRMVRVEAANPRGLPAGTQVSVEFPTAGKN